MGKSDPHSLGGRAGDSRRNRGAAANDQSIGSVRGRLFVRYLRKRRRVGGIVSCGGHALAAPESSSTGVQYISGRNADEYRCRRIHLKRTSYWVDPVEKSEPRSEPAEPVAEEEITLDREGSRGDVDPDSKVQEQLRELIADLSGTVIDAAQPGRTFLEMGLDSLILTQVARTITQTYKVVVSFRQLVTDASTLPKLAEFIARQSPELSKKHPVPVASTTKAFTIPAGGPSVEAGVPSSATQAALERVIVQQAQTIDRLVRLLEQSGGESGKMNMPHKAHPVDCDPFAGGLLEASLPLTEAQQGIWFSAQLGTRRQTPISNRCPCIWAVRLTPLA